MDVLHHDQTLAVESSLTFNSLCGLLMGSILAVRIPKFYETDRCKYLSDILSNSVKNQSTSSGKIYISDVDSFWNTLDKPELKESYFNTAIPTMRRLRKLSCPYASPMDLLRLELDEIWPSGASIMHLGTKTMLFGITRIWQVGFEALPHQDVFWREIPNSNEAKDQISQLGVNVYLSSADLGGELEIWNYSFSDEDCERHGIKGSYGFSRSLLPNNSLVIKPQAGDLIIFNTTKVHAIRKILQGERITISGFIGYWGMDKPLKCWS